MPAPLILLEVSPRRVADGVAETLYLAGLGGTTPYFYNARHWRGGLSGLPQTVCSLDFSNGEFGTGGVPTAASVTWTPQTDSDRALLSAYVWEDAQAVLRIGVEGTLPSGVIGQITMAQSEPGKLTLFFADVSQKLKVPVLTDRFAGTGGIEGPAEWEGKIKSRAFGRLWNVAGEMIDKANNILCFADPTRPLQSFDAIRDMGAPAAAADLTLLAWQGSVAATFAALQGASAPSGGGVLCPSIACVKWWTQPGGDLCVDLRGEIGSGYVDSTSEIVERVVGIVGGPAMSAGTVEAAKLARPAAIGLRIADDSTTAAAVLDSLLGNVSLLWIIDEAGQVSIRRWEWVASSGSFTSHSVKRIETHRPVGTRKLGYKKNEKVMARGDLAAIVLASDVVYGGGETVEELKPAQPGADVTGDNTSKDTDAVGGVPAPTLLQDIATANAAASQAQTDADQAKQDAADAQAAVEAAQQDIADQGAAILAAQADIIANASDITTLQTTQQSQGASITTLQQTVASNTGSISTLQTTVSTQGGQISTLQTSMTTAQGNISTLQTNVSTQGGQISTLQTSVTTNTGAISTLQTTVGTQGSAITVLQNASTTQAGQIATLTTQVTAGNPNLVKNGSGENGLNFWTQVIGSWESVASSSWGQVLRTSTNVANGAYLVLESQNIAVYSQPITLTADSALFINGGTGFTWLELHWYAADGVTEVGSFATGPSFGVSDFSAAGDKRRAMKLTATAPSNAPYTRIRLVTRKDTGTINVTGWRQVKLESGSNASQYTQDASVIQTYSAISTINTQVATLQTTVSTQGSTIAANATAITTLNTNVATLTTTVSTGTRPNLLKNGGFNNGMSNWAQAGLGGYVAYVSGGWGQVAQTSLSPADGSFSWLQSDLVPVYGTQQYTCTADCVLFTSSGSAFCYIVIAWYDGSGNYISENNSATRAASFDFSINNANRELMRCTATAPSNAVSAQVRLVTAKTSGTITTQGWRQAKLETGATATPYSTEASITQVFSAISTTNTQVASLSSTVSTQGVTITSNTTAITTLNGNMTTVLGRWGVEIDVNGYISGIITNNNGSRSDFTIRADKFTIIAPGGGERTEYSNGNWRVYNSAGTLKVQWGINI